MQRLRVAYNFGCRALYNLPWRASASSHQIQCNIRTFEALLRKNQRRINNSSKCSSCYRPCVFWGPAVIWQYILFITLYSI